MSNLNKYLNISKNSISKIFGIPIDDLASIYGLIIETAIPIGDGYNFIFGDSYTPPGYWEVDFIFDPLSDGDRGVIGGGNYVNMIDYVTISTTGNAIDFGDLTSIHYVFDATSNGGYDKGIFGGGYNSSVVINIISYIAISNAGDAQDYGDLTISRGGLTATSNNTNNRGIFAGGWNWSSGYYSTIDYTTISYNNNASGFGSLTYARYAPAGTSNAASDRGIFGGGYSGAISYTNIIDYITISTTGNALNFGDLLERRHLSSSCSNGTNDRGVFGGGYTSTGTRTNRIDYVTISTTGNASDFGDLTGGKNGLTSTSNLTNERGIFCGGWTGSVNLNVIDYITISTTGNATDFGDMTEGVNGRSSTSNA